MALSPSKRVARMREKNIKQKDIAQKLGLNGITHINNVLHNRNFKETEKSKKIRSAIAEAIGLSYKYVWG